MLIDHLNLDSLLGFVVGILLVIWIEYFRRARKQYESYRKPMGAVVMTQQTPQQVAATSSRACLTMALLVALPFILLMLFLR